MQEITLSNGVKMPQVGYGVFQVSPAECERCVSDALSVGYRMIDTAQAYQNEEGVGRAWKKSGIRREDLFLALGGVAVRPTDSVDAKKEYALVAMDGSSSGEVTPVKPE